MSFQLKDRSANSGPSYELNDDHMAGFVTAVNNNQLRMALEYLVRIVQQQSLEIAELKARANGTLEESPVETSVVDAPLVGEPKPKVRKTKPAPDLD